MRKDSQAIPAKCYSLITLKFNALLIINTRNKIIYIPVKTDAANSKKEDLGI